MEARGCQKTRTFITYGNGRFIQQRDGKTLNNDETRMPSTICSALYTILFFRVSFPRDGKAKKRPLSGIIAVVCGLFWQPRGRLTL